MMTSSTALVITRETLRRIRAAVAPLSLVLLTLCASPARAAELAFDVTVTATDERVTVRVANSGRDAAPEVAVRVELDGAWYEAPLAALLPPATAQEALFQVAAPAAPGAYPLVTTVYYRNEGVKLSLVNVGLFNVGTAEHGTFRETLPAVAVRRGASLELPIAKQGRSRLVLPEEIRVKAEKHSPWLLRYELENATPYFNNRYPYYLVTERELPGGIRETAIAKGELRTQRVFKALSVFPRPFFPFAAFVGLIGAVLLYRAYIRKSEGREQLYRSLIRWCFSLATVGALYTALHYLEFVPELLRRPNDPEIYPTARLGLVSRSLLGWLYFEGGNYDYFVEYLADLLFLYFLTANFLVLQWLIRPARDRDKYWNLAEGVLSPLVRRRKDWSPPATVAVLAIAVKAFYLPLLVSWFINNVFHQANLANSLNWGWHAALDFILALLILIDVGIFAAGYLFELPQLKNTIRSVEPTVLGWVVCLACYPPFNGFSFSYFDRPLQDHWAGPSEDTLLATKVALVVLWGIYVWASVALGLRASNLTNRGIVGHGPYRYVRHPAYASKLAVWSLESFALARLNFFHVLTLIVVYGLRAWTEERHLARDPDYVAYRSGVRWRFIPRVF